MSIPTHYDLLSRVYLLITALSGLVGVGLGGFLTSWNQRKERRERFILDQLREFYAPMLGIRERLRAKSEVRLKVSNAARTAWPRRLEEAPEKREEIWPEYEKIIEHDNQQLKEELIPLYGHMMDLFTAKMHLTEASTRAHFAVLVEFVEMWNRSLRGSLPREVAELVGANEDTLMPFYGDLKTNFDRLQSALKPSRWCQK